MSGIDPVPVCITAAILLIAIAAMGVSWRRRRRRQRHFVLPVLPADVGTKISSVDGLYLATTFAGRPLDRVVAGGLGFRAPATLTVTTKGVLFERNGEDPVFLPAAALNGAGVATWTIDRGVEKNGLTVLGWRLDSAQAADASSIDVGSIDVGSVDVGSVDVGSVDVESAFRIDFEPRAEFIAEVRSLVVTHAGPSPADAEGAPNVGA